MNTKQRQLKFVLDHLESSETLTAVKARCIYGIESLSSRISELRKEGHKIESIEIGGGFVKYELDDNAPFEREFFEFLKGYGGLDEYIERTTEHHGGFKLLKLPSDWIAGAFNWPFPTKYWGDLDKLWSLKLETLNNPTPTN